MTFTWLSAVGLGLLALYAARALVRHRRGGGWRAWVETAGHLLAAGGLAVWLLDPAVTRPLPLTGWLIVDGRSPELLAEAAAWRRSARAADGAPIRWTEASLDATPPHPTDGAVLLTDRPPGDRAELPAPLDVRLVGRPDTLHWTDVSWPIAPVAGREAVLTATLQLGSTRPDRLRARLTAGDSTLAEAPLRPAGVGEASATFAFQVATAGPLPLQIALVGAAPEPVLVEVKPGPTWTVGFSEAVPRWETRFLRHRLEAEPGLRLRATAVVGRGLVKTTTVGLDTTRRAALDPVDALDSLDVLILGGPSAFPTAPGAVARLTEWVHRGGGLVVLMDGADSSRFPTGLLSLLPARPRPGVLPPVRLPTSARPPAPERWADLTDRLARRLTETVGASREPLPELVQVPLTVPAPWGAVGGRVGLGRVTVVGWTDTWRLALAGGAARRAHDAFWREVLVWTGEGDPATPWGVPGPVHVGLAHRVVAPTGSVSVRVDGPTGRAPLDPIEGGAFIWTPDTSGPHRLLASFESGRTAEQLVDVIPPDRWTGDRAARVQQLWQARRGPLLTVQPIGRSGSGSRIPTWSRGLSPRTERMPLPHLIWAGLALLGFSLAWLFAPRSHPTPEPPR